MMVQNSFHKTNRRINGVRLWVCFLSLCFLLLACGGIGAPEKEGSSGENADFIQEGGTGNIGSFPVDLPSDDTITDPAPLTSNLHLLVQNNPCNNEESYCGRRSGCADTFFAYVNNEISGIEDPLEYLNENCTFAKCDDPSEPLELFGFRHMHFSLQCVNDYQAKGVACNLTFPGGGGEEGPGAEDVNAPICPLEPDVNPDPNPVIVD
jgi:hypothetical protein